MKSIFALLVLLCVCSPAALAQLDAMEDDTPPDLAKQASAKSSGKAVDAKAEVSRPAQPTAAAPAAKATAPGSETSAAKVAAPAPEKSAPATAKATNSAPTKAAITQTATAPAASAPAATSTSAPAPTVTGTSPASSKPAPAPVASTTATTAKSTAASSTAAAQNATAPAKATSAPAKTTASTAKNTTQTNAVASAGAPPAPQVSSEFTTPAFAKPAGKPGAGAIAHAQGGPSVKAPIAVSSSSQYRRVAPGAGLRRQSHYIKPIHLNPGQTTLQQARTVVHYRNPSASSRPVAQAASSQTVLTYSSKPGCVWKNNTQVRSYKTYR